MMRLLPGGGSPCARPSPLPGAIRSRLDGVLYNRRLTVSGKAAILSTVIAGWSSPVARQAHNLKVVGSNPAPAPKS
jgi:hypothetical protein